MYDSGFSVGTSEGSNLRCSLTTEYTHKIPSPSNLQIRFLHIGVSSRFLLPYTRREAKSMKKIIILLLALLMSACSAVKPAETLSSMQPANRLRISTISIRDASRNNTEPQNEKRSRPKPAPYIGYSIEVFIKNLIYGFNVDIKGWMVIILATKICVFLFKINIDYFVPKLLIFDVCNFIKQIP